MQTSRDPAAVALRESMAHITAADRTRIQEAIIGFMGSDVLFEKCAASMSDLRAVYRHGKQPNTIEVEIANLPAGTKAVLVNPGIPAAPARAVVLQECWDALDRLYASTDPTDVARRGIALAASEISKMKRGAQ
jgi:hypothetical protein